MNILKELKLYCSGGFHLYYYSIFTLRIEKKSAHNTFHN